jgi:hypothetical protein
MHFSPLNRKVVGSWLLEGVDGRLMNGGGERMGEEKVR